MFTGRSTGARTGMEHEVANLQFIATKLAYGSFKLAGSSRAHGTIFLSCALPTNAGVAGSARRRRQ